MANHLPPFTRPIVSPEFQHWNPVSKLRNHTTAEPHLSQPHPIPPPNARATPQQWPPSSPAAPSLPPSAASPTTTPSSSSPRSPSATPSSTCVISPTQPQKDPVSPNPEIKPYITMPPSPRPQPQRRPPNTHSSLFRPSDCGDGHDMAFWVDWRAGDGENDVKWKLIEFSTTDPRCCHGCRARRCWSLLR